MLLVSDISADTTPNASAGGISGISGISAPYETPSATELVFTTDPAGTLSLTTQYVTTYYSGIVSSGAIISTVTFTTKPTPSPQSDLAGGEIAGVVIAALAGVALVLVAGWLLLRRRRARNRDQPPPYPTYEDAPHGALQQHEEKDGIPLSELQGEEGRPSEAGGGPLLEMEVPPSELEAEYTRPLSSQAPVEMGIRSPAGTVSKRI
ncbi:Cell wall integrity and stress response component 4 [Elasticomyces elasticus]|nr:Cell wall integrity and stress response component 4 [Elasticomyces elasticus]KAK3662918.1 Cell wall integrity and stress response component 4 [Elasticomyces elasticus]KAK4930114.1 Cell wall integrity and stress response component 4 [Elasticomyces elasticus]KAK5763505.1 Cell wall integrity and stress response component 4 [Elasticomyces elasticus]